MSLVAKLALSPLLAAQAALVRRRLPRLPEMTSEALHRAFARHFNLADFLEAPA